MCLRRAPEKYITGAMAPVGAALDRAALTLQTIMFVQIIQYKYKFSSRKHTVPSYKDQFINPV
jgi:hypothetical protein